MSQWTPEAMLKVREITNVRVSPDGKRVAYVVASPVMTDEKSEFVSQIYLASTDGSGSFQATFGEKSSVNPQWSPDGEFLAFTSARSGESQLYVMRANGGEAEAITSGKGNVGAFHWSPDGSQIAFVQPDSPTDDDEKREKSKDDWRWVEEDIKFSRLYVVALAKDENGKREPRLLTKEDTQVGGEVMGPSPFDWSPDGKRIVYVRTKAPLADHWPTADLYSVDITDGETKPFLTGSAAHFQPRFSPDGNFLACTISDDPPTWAFMAQIALVPADGGEPKRFAPTFDGQPLLIGWSEDGKSLYFTEGFHTLNRLYTLDIATGDVSVLDDGANGLILEAHLNPTKTHFSFTRQAPAEPKEAFVAAVSDYRPVRVSRINADIPDLPLGTTEILHWHSPDGTEVEGLLTYPVGCRTGEKVPLLLIIHGGPAGVYTQNFIAALSIYPVASFAAAGYACLRVNPRGSSGYGKAFRHANRKDWGGGDYQDLMAGVDLVLERGIADPERLGVMGWSYGGFMTSWTITQTHRFKAASVGAAVTNLMSFNGTADIPSFVPDYFGVESWDDLELYRDHSAMFQVKGVTTPSLIQHGEADVRVPITQGYEFYNALKRQGVPTRMLVLPRQPHGPTEPRMLLKVAQTNLEWFDTYLQK